MMLGFLNKNDKGFYLVENGKFMFIERHCKEELHEGLCEYRELIDKGKYSFIQARNVVSGTYEEAVNSGVVSLRLDVSCYRYKDFNFWKYSDEDNFNYYAYVDGKIYEFNSTSSLAKYLADNRWNWKSVPIDSFYIEQACASSIRPSTEELVDLVIPKIGSTYLKILYSEKMNIVQIQTKFRPSYHYAIIDGVAVSLMSENCVRDINDWSDITDKVTSFILDNNLAIQSKYCSDDNGLVSKTVYLANGDCISRLFLSTYMYSRERLATVKDTLDSSRRNFDEYRNTIGKKMSTKAALDILPKFNCKSYQLGAF